jgi:hypothetical protein
MNVVHRTSGLKPARSPASVSAPTASTCDNAPGQHAARSLTAPLLSLGSPWLPAAAMITICGVSSSTARAMISGASPSAV